MKIPQIPFLKRFWRTPNSANTQSTGINGDRNIVDQSVTNIYYGQEGPVPTQVPFGEKVNAFTEEQTFTEFGSPKTLSRTLRSTSLTKAARYDEKPVTIFLAGPFIEPEKESASNSSAASILRYQLFHRLVGENFAVSLGTYRDSMDAFKAGTGDYHNAAEAELRYATDVASLVVMIPDSPGSFAEIGAFALRKDICTKMIILADVTHEGSLGYLNAGPVACAKALGSKIERVDYNDVDGCFEIVKDFSNGMKTKIQLQSRLEV